MAFGESKYNRKHARELNESARRIKALFDRIYGDVAAIGSHTSYNDASKEFHFENYPVQNEQIDDLLSSLSHDITSVIEQGNATAFATSLAKHEALLQYTQDNFGFGDEYASKIKSVNLDALAQFQKRKINGMNLSQRVWDFVKNDKQRFELALEMSIPQGKSAARMSRDVREFLQYPDKLFRRVRDEKGVLRLSKAAQAFHSGRGVYRSSYKNALRLTATENNIAHRTADYEQNQELDFVIGIVIHTSDNHPVADICDTLKGEYPKEFKFTGWHPWCRCYTTTKLPTHADFVKRRRMAPEEAQDFHYEGEVKDMPANFNKWVKDNEERIANAKSTPYFLKDNFKGGDYKHIVTRESVSIKMGYAEKGKKIKERVRDYSAKKEAREAYALQENNVYYTIQDKSYEAKIKKSIGMRVDEKIYSKFHNDVIDSINYYNGEDNCICTTMEYILKRQGFNVNSLRENTLPRGLREHPTSLWNGVIKELDVASPSKLAEATKDRGIYFIEYDLIGEKSKGHIIAAERLPNGKLCLLETKREMYYGSIEKCAKNIRIVRVDNAQVKTEYLRCMVEMVKRRR